MKKELQTTPSHEEANQIPGKADGEIQQDEWQGTSWRIQQNSYSYEAANNEPGGDPLEIINDSEKESRDHTKIMRHSITHANNKI